MSLFNSNYPVEVIQELLGAYDPTSELRRPYCAPRRAARAAALAKRSAGSTPSRALAKVSESAVLTICEKMCRFPKDLSNSTGDYTIILENHG